MKSEVWSLSRFLHTVICCDLHVMFSEKNHLQFLVGAIFDDSETSFLQFHLQHGEMNPSLQSTMAWGLWCHRHSLNTANERGSPLTTPRGPTKHQGVVQDDKMTNPTHTVSVVQKEVWRYCVCMAVIVQITYCIQATTQHQSRSNTSYPITSFVTISYHTSSPFSICHLFQTISLLRDGDIHKMVNIDFQVFTTVEHAIL